MVLDLRLMKIGCLGRYPSFFVYVSHHFSFVRTKENEAKRKLAVCIFFFLLQYFSSLNKKNSLCSNSFLFLTLQKALPLNGKKMRTDLDVLWGGGMKYRFARWSNLSSYNIEVFTSASEAKELENTNHQVNIHLKQLVEIT